MTIPNAEHASVDLRKLRDYCLNPQHSEGKHKARLFIAALGLTAADAEALRAAVLQAVKTQDAQLGRHDSFGQRYTVDFLFEWHGKQALVRSGWICEKDSEPPRLTTCYPL